MGLFAEPSFLEGFARVLDIGGTMQEYNTSGTGEEADAKALRNDWLAVGDDLRFSIKNHERELAK